MYIKWTAFNQLKINSIADFWIREQELNMTKLGKKYFWPWFSG